MSPAARVTDPETSHEAAAAVTDLTGTQSAILDLLKIPMTDEALVHAYQGRIHQGRAPLASESGIRTRRKELVDRGLVRDSGRRGRMALTGRKSIIWELA